MQSGPVHWFKTFTAARKQHGKWHLPEIYRHHRQQQQQRLTVLVVDASGSTLRHRALASIKGVVAALLNQAYLQRQQVALITFSGSEATILFSAARALKVNDALLAAIKGGGGTPLKQAIKEADQLLLKEKKKHPQQQQSLIVLTDGRSKEMPSSMIAKPDALVIDTEAGNVRLHRAQQLAYTLQADYSTISEITEC